MINYFLSFKYLLFEQTIINKTLLIVKKIFQKLVSFKNFIVYYIILLNFIEN